MKKQSRKKEKRKEAHDDDAHPRWAESPCERVVWQEFVREIWFDESPFVFADRRQVDSDYPNTNIQPDLIEAILSELRPAFWLELGTMLGGSALMTAEAIKRLGLATSICCVDPFTGDANMWAWERELRERGEWRYLNLEAGRPTIYERFLANVRRAGHDDTIVPIVSTSLVALRLLQILLDQGRLSRLPDVIYLDSAHEPEETLLEMRRAWAILQPGGVLFGDDWLWPSVREDARTMARSVETDTARMVSFLRRFDESHLDGNVFLYGGQWVLFKPGN